MISVDVGCRFVLRYTLSAGMSDIEDKDGMQSKASTKEEEGSSASESEEDGDDLGVVATELSQDRVDLLLQLFDALDKDQDGKLTVKDFQKLGEVMTGRRPSKESALAQLRRADLDADDEVGKDEWLDFSSNLARMHKIYFEDCMHSYIGKLKLLADEKMYRQQAASEHARREEEMTQKALGEYAHKAVVSEHKK